MGRNSGADLFLRIPGRLKLKRPLTPPPAHSKIEALDFFRDLAWRDSIRHTSEMPAEIRRPYAPHRQEADRLWIPSDDHLYYLLTIGYAKRDRIISETRRILLLLQTIASKNQQSLPARSHKTSRQLSSVISSIVKNRAKISESEFFPLLARFKSES